MAPRLAGILAIVLVCAGCAATQGPRPAPAVDVTGRWVGQVSGVVGAFGVSMTLRQVGADVTGEIAVSGWAQASGPLNGKVSGDTFEYRGPGDTGAVTSVKGNEMKGRTTYGSNLDMQRQ